MKKQSNPTNSPATLAHKLWDEIFKSIINHMPDQFLPLFKHVFQKNYPKDTDIELLSAEYPTPNKANPQTLSSVFADIVLRVSGSDIYHMECQIEKDDTISVRMVEYDTHISILYNHTYDSKTGEHTLRFPDSIILYLGNNSTVPDKRTCHILFPDGTDTVYSVPIIKVQDYPLPKIGETHLAVFLPFTLLRLRPKLKSKKKPLTKKELTMFVKEIMIILNNELDNGYVTHRQYKDYINYIQMAADQIFAHHPHLNKEVSNMLTSIIPSYSEMEDQITARVTSEVTARVTAEITDEVTAKVTDELSSKWSLELQKKDSLLSEWYNWAISRGYDEQDLPHLG